ncbi:serine hydrolase domain-containing protein [Bowmanella pacifica]|uniref:Beta-lactamase-related domain-containing protein n=1 Tax=Bowmanella pacifica TaxID=502051 RepID=A0A917Z2G6_9ALTE|nr:serine hydrolase domain-containing protein [Bowmanella pacifica]GGO73003.1 hypothetical protein GCM10010982_32520 [Bowmanella pacifica]
MLKNTVLVCSLSFLALGVHGDSQEQVFRNVLNCHSSPENPGLSVRLEQQGKLIFTGAAGVSNLETGKPLSREDVFQIGSVTKQFTAAAILMLQEQGKLSVKDNVKKHLPAFAHNNITIEQLLSHTSGLADYFTEADVTDHWHQYTDIDQIIEKISAIEINAAPGEQYQYSNVGYLYLGKIIESVSGESYAGFLQKHIFTPLEMHSSFVMTQGDSLKQVVGYTQNRGQKDHFTQPFKVDRSWMYAAGAIASTVANMGKWQQALMTGKVISPNSYKLMTTKAALANGEEVDYGFGINISPIAGQPSFHHEGQVPGFMAWSVYLPKSDLYAVALSNNDAAHPGPALLDMMAIQLGLSPQPVSAEQASSVASNLLGKYRFEDGKTLELFEAQGKWFGKTDNQAPRELVLRENNAFSYACSENYFELRHSERGIQLVPMHLYFGEGKSANRL